MQEKIRLAARNLAKATKVVVFTGAGVSKESGVPTFRDAREGLWARYDPMQLATPQGFRENPKLVWDWYAYRREVVLKTEPNPGHQAIAELEDLLPNIVVVTQNVDNLHQRAGSTDIIPLHGNLFAFKCSDDCQGHPTVIKLEGLEWEPEEAPPRCPHCDVGLVRPDVVWFHEALHMENLERAYHEAETCQAMLVVGTSGIVYPAAWIPIKAMLKDAYVIEVNPNSSDLTARMSVFLQAPSGEALPQLITALRQELSA